MRCPTAPATLLLLSCRKKLGSHHFGSFVDLRIEFPPNKDLFLYLVFIFLLTRRKRSLRKSSSLLPFPLGSQNRDMSTGSDLELIGADSSWPCIPLTHSDQVLRTCLYCSYYIVSPRGIPRGFPAVRNIREGNRWLGTMSVISRFQVLDRGCFHRALRLLLLPTHLRTWMFSILLPGLVMMVRASWGVSVEVHHHH